MLLTDKQMGEYKQMIYDFYYQDWKEGLYKIPLSQLNYTNSFDSIIPVYNKCIDVINNVTREPNGYELVTSEEFKKLRSALYSCTDSIHGKKIEAHCIFSSVLNFINWYNKNKQK